MLFYSANRSAALKLMKLGLQWASLSSLEANKWCPHWGLSSLLLSFYGTFRNAISTEMFPPLSNCLAGSQGVQKAAGPLLPFPEPGYCRMALFSCPTDTQFQREARARYQRSQCMRTTSASREKLGVKHLMVWKVTACFLRVWYMVTSFGGTEHSCKPSSVTQS